MMRRMPFVGMREMMRMLRMMRRMGYCRFSMIGRGCHITREVTAAEEEKGGRPRQYDGRRNNDKQVKANLQRRIAVFNFCLPS